MKKCVIFAGGELDCAEIDTASLKREADLIICADKGVLHARKLGVSPDIILGDFDSYTGEVIEECEIIRTVPEKDDTDTIMAVKLAIEKGFGRIILYGALGGRFDHTFANIQTLVYAREHGCELTISDSSCEISLQGKGCKRYPKRENYYFSVFALTESVDIERLSGVKYPLVSYTMRQSFPIGVSNEITSEFAELSIKSGLALIVRAKM